MGDRRGNAVSSDEAGRMSALMLDAIGQAVIATDLRGLVTYWNAAAEALYGWHASEAIGRPVTDLTVPELAAQQAADILQHLAAGRAWTGEFTVQRRDGTRFPAIVADSGIYDDDGELVGIVGVSTDLTETRRAEQARLDSENRLRAVVEDSPVVLVAFDVSGVLVLAEGRDLDRLGLPARSLIGKTLAQLSAETPAAAEAVRRGLAGKCTDEKLGFLGRHFDFRFRPRRNLAGEVEGVLAVGNDITDSVEAADREERWRSLVAQSADAAIITDPTTTAITYVSAAVTRLFGWEPEALIGRPGVELVHPGDLARVTAALTQIAEPDTCVGIEFRFECADGSYRWVEDTISNLTGVRGVRGLVGNLRDVTVRRAAEDALTRRDRVTRALARQAADVALVLDPDGRVRYGNPSASAVFVPAEGETFYGADDVHPEDRHRVLAAFQGLHQPGATARMTYRRLGVDDAWRWVEQVVTNCVGDPDIDGLVVNIREISDMVEAETALRESESRFRLIAETAQEGIWATDSAGRTLFANQTMANLLGRPLSDLYDTPPWDLITGSTREGYERRLRRRQQQGTDRYDLRHTRPDGDARILRVCASQLASDDGPGSLAMVSDITEARAAEAELRHRAHHDLLTGLANRTLLMERLAAALSDDDSPRPSTVAVLVADIDQFKLVNDSYGHAAGDELLVEVARRWQCLVDDRDGLARFGGDEFVIVRPGLDLAGAEALAAALTEAMDEPVRLAGREVTVTASIGIAISTGAEEADALLRYADAAMYEAKSKGRGRTAVFTACLAAGADRRLNLFTELKAAIANDDLELHYQPVVELRSGRTLGVEALCRWDHPERGAVRPDEFIAVAEKTGLIEVLDRWVLRRACRDGAVLLASGALPADAYIAVNVSAGHLSQPGFEVAVRSALAEYALPATALVLEVTESAVMHEPDTAKAVLERLQSLGVRVAIDDFGTGHSSLAYLQWLPVAALKIDRSFIRRLSGNPDDRAIVTAVISLAQALKLTTTAEGIETAADLALLQQLGCHAGQGYLWSRAVPLDQLVAAAGTARHARFALHRPTKVLPPPRGDRTVTDWSSPAPTAARGR